MTIKNNILQKSSNIIIIDNTYSVKIIQCFKRPGHIYGQTQPGQPINAFMVLVTKRIIAHTDPITNMH